MYVRIAFFSDCFNLMMVSWTAFWCSATSTEYWSLNPYQSFTIVMLSPFLSPTQRHSVQPMEAVFWEDRGRQTTKSSLPLSVNKIISERSRTRAGLLTHGVCGCFCSAVARLSSRDRGLWPSTLRQLLSGSLQKKAADSCVRMFRQIDDRSAWDWPVSQPSFLSNQ